MIKLCTWCEKELPDTVEEKCTITLLNEEVARFHSECLLVDMVSFLVKLKKERDEENR